MHPCCQAAALAVVSCVDCGHKRNTGVHNAHITPQTIRGASTKLRGIPSTRMHPCSEAVACHVTVAQLMRHDLSWDC
jgi:hypothetical protein